MNWRPDRTAKKAIYKQIADYIERGIGSGEFPADSLLPSERTMAALLQVNRSTVISAYEELQSLGIVERKKGSGTRISTDIWGVAHKRMPNWGRYMEDGSLMPNGPLVQRIRSEAEKRTVINLASGELAPSLFPNEEFKKILSTTPFNEHLGYDHPQGNRELREVICAHMKKEKQIEVHPESMLITSGAQQALHLIARCLLKPGDVIAVEDPSYCLSLPIFQSAGFKVCSLPVDEHGVKPDDIRAFHQKHKLRMLFLNPDHQNPTGAVLSHERRKEILALSYELGIPIIEDDPYSLTTYNGEVHPTLKSMDANGNVLYVSSLSKIVASGLRVGWMIGPPQVVQRLADAKQQIDFGHSIVPQWLAKEFLGSATFENHMMRLRVQLENQKHAMTSSLQKSFGEKISFLVPQGGIHLWFPLPKPVDEYQLLDRAIQRGVSFVPGSIMGSHKGYVRFTYGREEPEAIREGVRRFAEAFQDTCRNEK